VGAGITPTLFHVSNKHIGPFVAFRHSITPGISYSYSPEADVSDKYLAALGRVRPGYLGALAQNRVSFSFSQVLEAKYKPKSDSEPPGTEKKIRLLSMQISALDYDFELAKATGRTGLASEHANISLRSDLIPGFDLSLDYSLFDAPVISDTARFSIYQEGIRAGLTLGKGSSGLGPLARLWAWATGERPRAQEDTGAVAIANRTNPPQTQGTGGLGAIPGLGGMNNAAQRSRATLTDLQPNQPWSATLGFSAHRPRPPHGSNVVSLDPRATCEPFRNTDPVQFNTCLRQQPPISTDYTNTQTTGGGIVYQLPPTIGFTSNMQFALTQNWTTSWQMNYDVQRHELTSQIIQLQRDLRDWRAAFGFTQGVNGNFGFHFLITLKPVPDLQLPYDQQSLRSTPSR
jgi:hypothetical protein